LTVCLSFSRCLFFCPYVILPWLASKRTLYAVYIQAYMQLAPTVVHIWKTKHLQTLVSQWDRLFRLFDVVVLWPADVCECDRSGRALAATTMHQLLPPFLALALLRWRRLLWRRTFHANKWLTWVETRQLHGTKIRQHYTLISASVLPRLFWCLLFIMQYILYTCISLSRFCATPNSDYKILHWFSHRRDCQAITTFW